MFKNLIIAILIAIVAVVLFIHLSMSDCGCDDADSTPGIGNSASRPPKRPAKPGTRPDRRPTTSSSRPTATQQSSINLRR